MAYFPEVHQWSDNQASPPKKEEEEKSQLSSTVISHLTFQLEISFLSSSG
jgi:hypothetical protein